MAIPQTASGTARDRDLKSYVDSPLRGPNYTAKEVFVSNTDENPIPTEPHRGPVLSAYNEINLSGLSSATLLTKTISASNIGEIVSIQISGENVAYYEIKINGQTINKTRTYYTEYNANIVFNGLKVEASSVITINVENKSNSLAEFNATLLYREYNEY